MATILIVEDETGVRTFLTTLLRSRSHRVLAAGDVSQAIAVFHAEKPELVITDIVMPDRDGFDFIRELRADRLGKTIPIIIHTGLFADRDTRAFSQACGVHFVLEKPASVTLILETVERALGSAPPAVEMPAEFERDHLRLLTNHLGRKLHDLHEEIARRRQLEAVLRKSEEHSKQAEQALRGSQAQLASVIDSAMDAIITLDAQQRIVLFNAAAEKMFRCAADEAIGQTIERFIPPRFREAHADYIRHFASTGVINRRMGKLGVVYGMRADGGELPIEASISQVEVEGGKLFTVILRDITDRRKAETTLRTTAERLRVVSRNVIEAQETERRYLARELHDEIGQVLSAISVNLKIVKTKVDASAWSRLQESIHLVDEAVQQVRNLSLDLRPTVLDEFGLEAALRWYADRVSERTGLRIHVTAEPAPTEIPADVRNTCFRVAQEALTNVVRHAAARTVWIELLPQQSDVQLSVRDDGKGFDVAAARQRAAQGDSFGLLSMWERIELLGGSFELESKPGQGASVRVRAPLANVAPSIHEDKEL